MSGELRGSSWHFTQHAPLSAGLNTAAARSALFPHVELFVCWLAWTYFCTDYTNNIYEYPLFKNEIMYLYLSPCDVDFWGPMALQMLGS